MKKVFCLSLVLLLILSTAFTPALAAKAKTKITLSHKGTVKLDLGKTLKITATVTPEGTVKWKSSKTKVATVDQDGNVKAIKEGTATITAKVGKKTAKVKIKVYDSKKPKKLTLKEGKKKTLTAGDTLQLTPKLSPKGAESDITFKSSKPNIAAVDANGKVTALKKGKAKITVTSTKNKKAKAVITITVKKAPKTSSKDLSKAIGKTAPYIASNYGLKIVRKSVQEDDIFWVLEGSGVNMSCFGATKEKAVFYEAEIFSPCKHNVGGATIGMEKAKALAALKASGWQVEDSSIDPNGDETCLLECKDAGVELTFNKGKVSFMLLWPIDE